MVQGSKVLKVELSNYGSYLGRAEGCFEIRDKNGKVERYPHFQKEIGEAVLKSGSYVSVDALIDLALWDIDTYIVTKRNCVVAVLKNLEDDSHVKTRLCQYEALRNGKGLRIAKQILMSKLEGQNAVLKKHGLRLLDPSTVFRIEELESESLESARKKLILIESHNAKRYFNQIFSLFPKSIRPEGRTGYKAYDGLNNVFNFAYYILKCRAHKALLKARLEPYLGFLHSVQYGKPSLVCDFQELYRYLIDDFLIERSQKMRKKDFVLVTDFMMSLRMGKRIHLCEFEANGLAEGLNSLFDRTVEIPRMRYGSKQTLATLINEEAYLLAKFLRSERKAWIPRIGGLT
jgi:CRISPR-associated protein Cas1